MLMFTMPTVLDLLVIMLTLLISTKYKKTQADGISISFADIGQIKNLTWSSHYMKGQGIT